MPSPALPARQGRKDPGLARAEPSGAHASGASRLSCRCTGRRGSEGQACRRVHQRRLLRGAPGPAKVPRACGSAAGAAADPRFLLQRRPGPLDRRAFRALPDRSPVRLLFRHGGLCLRAARRHPGSRHGRCRFREMAGLCRPSSLALAGPLPARGRSAVCVRASRRIGIRSHAVCLRGRITPFRRARAGLRRASRLARKRGRFGAVLADAALSLSLPGGRSQSRVHRHDGLLAERRCRGVVCRTGHAPAAAGTAGGPVPYCRRQSRSPGPAAGREPGDPYHAPGPRRATIPCPRRCRGGPAADRARHSEQGAGGDGDGAAGRRHAGRIRGHTRRAGQGSARLCRGGRDGAADHRDPRRPASAVARRCAPGGRAQSRLVAHVARPGRIVPGRAARTGVPRPGKADGMRGYSFSLAAEDPGSAVRRRWLVAAAALAVGLVSLAVMFRGEAAAAVRVWIDSTAYNHCFLVLPVAAYLLWERRQVLAALSPQPAPWLALAAVPAALCWLLAERAGIWEARQLLAMSLVQILLLAVLGPRCWRALSAPLLYLFFLVPVGGFLVPALQNFTAHFMAAGLDILRIPNYSTGVTIEIPEGTFYVAEACAGLRFLVASVAFGVLYGCVMYTSPLRRLLFAALSLVVPVIANGFRALGLVVLAHLLGNAAAVETDHVLYGWLFFSIVTFVLILVGLPFRQTPRPTAPVDAVTAGPHRRDPVAVLAGIAAAAVILCVAAPRLLADRLDSLAVPAISGAGPRLPDLPGCTALPPSRSPVTVAATAAGLDETRAYRCAGDTFLVAWHRYPPRISARPLFKPPHPQAGWRGLQAAAVRGLDIDAGGAVQHWQIAEFGRDARYAAIATTLWIAGRPAGNTIASRLRQAVNALSPAPLSPAAVIVSYTTTQGAAHGRRALERFLAGAAAAFARLAG